MRGSVRQEKRQTGFRGSSRGGYRTSAVLSDRRLPGSFPVARVAAVEIAVHWRWVAALTLGTILLATVLPGRFPGWDAPTLWLTSAAAVVAGEVMLLLHELSHVFAARGRGHAVQRIVFHGFAAETVLVGSAQVCAPRHEVLIALVGPGTNLALAGAAAALRLVLPADSPGAVLALLLALGNTAMAAMSLLPVGPSDGRRALLALRKSQQLALSSQPAGPSPHS
jgi:Zn-dependent protease